MTSIAWIVVLGVLAFAGAVASCSFGIRARSLDRQIRNMLSNDRRRAEYFRHERSALWEPEFITDDVESFAVRLIRRGYGASNSSYVANLNELLIGEVKLGTESSDAEVQKVVLRARATMAELNAFIDSYTDGEVQ